MSDLGKSHPAVFIIPSVLTGLFLAATLLGAFYLSKSVLDARQKFQDRGGDLPDAFIAYPTGSNFSSSPEIVEASSLLDTAPLFVPGTRPGGESPWEFPLPENLGTGSAFPDFPAEIQLDGAHFAVAARMSIPVGQAVEQGLSKLRESTIGFDTLGRSAPAEQLPPPEPRACELSLTHLDSGKSWTHVIPTIEGLDTTSPLWEPITLFAAVASHGLVAPPSPANTTGIESLDKMLLHAADGILRKEPFPPGNYRILIAP